MFRQSRHGTDDRRVALLKIGVDALPEDVCAIAIQQDQTWSQQLRPQKTDGDPFATGQIPAEFFYTAVKTAQPIQQRPKPFIPSQACKHAIDWMGEHPITKTWRMDPSRISGVLVMR